MSIRLQIFIGIVILVAFFFIVNMVRKKKIDLRYALGWLCTLAIVFVLDLFPQIVFWFAQLIGIDIPSNMVFLVGLFVAIILIYSLTVSVSNQSHKIKRLTQEVALLRKELEQLQKAND